MGVIHTCLRHRRIHPNPGINLQHRLVYLVLEDEKIVKVIRMWPHYNES